MLHFRSVIALAILSAIVAACGGGSASQALPSLATPNPQAGTLANARIVIVIPARAPASTGRRPSYISASTQSLTVQVDTGTPTMQNLTPTSPNCVAGGSGVTCTVPISATAGSHTFTFTTYDLINATGNKLSVNSTTQTLVANALTTVNVTLAGIPKALQITAVASPTIAGNSTSGFQFASAATQTLVVNAVDADNNVILGPGAPVFAATATSVQTGSGITVNPVGGNPNEFTVASSGFGTATFSASATPTSPLAGGAIAATAPLSATTFTTTIAGTLNTSGYTNGTGTGATFYRSEGITYDPITSDLYVYDAGNFAVRQVTTTGTVTTIAGAGPTLPGFVDGTGTAAKFSGGLVGIAYAAITGALYVGDFNNCAIRAVTTAGVVTTIAGQFPSTPACGFVDGTGSSARLYSSLAITYDSTDNNLYIADTYLNCAIRKVTTGGVVTTIAGANPASCGYMDGTGSTAKFSVANGIAFDSADGALYVSDTGNNVIRRVTTAGVVTTFVGVVGSVNQVDGNSTTARFDNGLGAIAYDSDNGNLYVSDNCAIRQITPSGDVLTIAGAQTCSPSIDGIGSNARFGMYSASGGLVYVPGSSSLYVADYGGSAIRKIQL